MYIHIYVNNAKYTNNSTSLCNDRYVYVCMLHIHAVQEQLQSNRIHSILIYYYTLLLCNKLSLFSITV